MWIGLLLRELLPVATEDVQLIDQSKGKVVSETRLEEAQAPMQNEC